MSDDDTKCPVCHDRFPASMAVFHSEAGGVTVHFDSVTCKKEFDADPDSYPSR